MGVITLASNPVTAQLIDVDHETKLSVSELLSYPIEGGGDWSGVSTFFKWGDSTLPAGFVPAVYKHLTNLGHSVVVVRDKAPEALGNPVRECVVDAFDPDPRYDYQFRAVELLAKHRQVIIQVATGGGKSRIAKLAYEHIKRPTLFLTTRKVLMHQMRDAIIKDMGIKVGVIGESKLDVTTGFNVGMVQTLSQMIAVKSPEDELMTYLDNRFAKEKRSVDAFLKDKCAHMSAPIRLNALREYKADVVAARKPDKEITETIQAKVEHHNNRAKIVRAMLAKFELVIMEEAHETSGDGYYSVMGACKNAWYRMALTATPFMSDNQAANFRLMATAGDVALQVSEKELIDKGILATPLFRYLDSDCPLGLKRSTAYKSAYKLGISEHSGRNGIIAAESVRAARHGLGALILIHHTAHGKLLLKMISELDGKTPCAFISGSSSKAERDAGLALLAGGGILIGSTILDVGVDVPSVGFLAIGGGGKAEVGLRQRIGRALRAKKKGPNVCHIIDFTDQHNTHLRGHALMRRRIVEGTPGFGENILAGDFDYSVFLEEPKVA